MKHLLITTIATLMIGLPWTAAVPRSDGYYGKTKVAPMAQVKAYPFDLGQVKLLPSPFERAMKVNQKYLLDLDADRDVTRENGNHVSKWVNQAPGAPAGALDFVKRDQGRKIAGSGRPVLKEKVKALKGHSALVFRQGELVNMDEDAFDGLTTGRGFTWFCVLSVYPQRVGVKDVNSFFGNLRNGHKYEGLWANLKD